jgi:hypothetical protein
MEREIAMKIKIVKKSSGVKVDMSCPWMVEVMDKPRS